MWACKSSVAHLPSAPTSGVERPPDAVGPAFSQSYSDITEEGHARLWSTSERRRRTCRYRAVVGNPWRSARPCRSSVPQTGVREGAHRYLAGLLGRVERKNSLQMAEQMGERGPQGTQRLLNAARWDADAVHDELRDYVVEYLGDEQSGVLVVDETGFLKRLV